MWISFGGQVGPRFHTDVNPTKAGAPQAGQDAGFEIGDAVGTGVRSDPGHFRETLLEMPEYDSQVSRGYHQAVGVLEKDLAAAVS